MQIGKINNYDTNFGKLIITERGQKFLSDKLTTTQLSYVETCKKELEDTKHFDLEIDGMKDFFIRLLPKNKSYKECGVPFVPDVLDGIKIKVWGRDLSDCWSITDYDLHFPTRQKAADAYNSLKNYSAKSMSCSHKDKFNIFKWAVDSAKIINESYDYMHEAGLLNK